MTVAALMVDRAANSNKIHNIHVSSAKIGFLVGAAPSQETCYGGARAGCKTPPKYGKVAPEGYAVPTPLSESYIHGLSMRGCEKVRRSVRTSPCSALRFLLLTMNR